MSPVRLFSKLLLTALVPALLATGCAGNRVISGTITGPDGAPLDRAIVSLAPGNVQLMTDRQGRFAIDYLRDDGSDRTSLDTRQDYTLDVFKPGYGIATQSFYYKKGEHTVGTIALSPEVLRVQDDGENLVPTLDATPTQSGGATYEGQ